MPEIIGRLWTSRKHHEWSCLSYLNCTGQDTPPKDCITWGTCCSVSVMANSLWPHGQQHVRLPWSSLSPRVCSSSCPLSLWCHPTILSPVVPFSSVLPRIRVFSNGSALHIRWPKCWSNIYSLPEDLYVSFWLIKIICWIKSSKQAYYLIITCNL